MAARGQRRARFLGPDQFVRALRVIAMAQSGVDAVDISAASLEQAVASGALPVADLEGIDAESGPDNNPFEASEDHPRGGDGSKGSGTPGGSSSRNSAGRNGSYSAGGKVKIDAKAATSIVDSLKGFTSTSARRALKFGSFYSLLTDGDFEGKPNVLLLGQYAPARPVHQAPARAGAGATSAPSPRRIGSWW